MIAPIAICEIAKNAPFTLEDARDSMNTTTEIDAMLCDPKALDKLLQAHAFLSVRWAKALWQEATLR